MTLPRYQDPDWKDQKPPTLIGEGARVNPEWLMRFLNNPSLTDDTKIRIATACASICTRACPRSASPTARFTSWCDSSRRCRRRPQPFIADKLDPLTDQERTMARQLFSSEGAPCLKCHATGDPKHERKPPRRISLWPKSV